jgi:hypothetical protein
MTAMDLVLGQSPAAAASASAGAAAESATQAAASAAQAVASAASIGFTAGASVINDAGRLAVAMPIKMVGANYTIGAADRGLLLAATGSPISLPAASALPSGFICAVKNAGGSGDIVLTCASNLDGAASIALKIRESFLIQSDGTVYRSVGRAFVPFGTSVVDDGGSLAVAMPSRLVTADYTVVAADRGHLINANGTGNRTITLPTGASVGSTWFAAVRNSLSGTGVVTLQAAPGELIDGVSSWTLGADDAFFIQSSGGISWRTIGRRRTQTVSTAAPSGGKDGDLWYQV